MSRAIFFKDMLSPVKVSFEIFLIFYWSLIKNQIAVQFSCSVMSYSSQPHGLQDSKLPFPSPTPRACSNSSLSSQWCHSIISFSVVHFSCFQSFPASGSFPVSQLFAWRGKSIGALASTSGPPMTIQNWFPLGLTGLNSFQSKGLSRLFSNSTVRKHQFCGD